MLKREIKYEDFNGNPIVETFYFNISKTEIVELQVEHKEGLSAFLQNIINSQDNKELVKRFKEIVLLAYGEKSDDGKFFIKNDDIREKFSHSAAYEALFMELVSDEGAAATFVNGILPKDMVVEKDQDKPASLPASAMPSPPTN